MAVFTIYRDSWRRGGSGEPIIEDGDTVSYRIDAVFGDTALLNDRNMMCCLGQCSFEAGVPLKFLKEAEPHAISLHFHDELEAHGLITIDLDEIDVITLNSGFSNEAMPINDNEDIEDAEREQQLIWLAEEHGHTLTFLDGIAPWFQEAVPNG